ncbi:MAG: EutN/CcmL family microcompartment protein [Pyrinomonadaceae bacterium]
MSVAVDTVGAGFHERVLVVAGSSARLAEGNKDCPVDAAIVGVIDTIDVEQAGINVCRISDLRFYHKNAACARHRNGCFDR